MFTSRALALAVIVGLAAALVLVPPERGVGERSETATIFVSLPEENRIIAADPLTLRVVGSWEVGPRPHAMTLTPAGRVLVATRGDEGVALLDPHTDDVTRASVGGDPTSVAVSGESAQAYVLSPDRVLAILSLPDAQMLIWHRVQGEPYDLVVLNGQAWITDLPVACLYVRDFSSGEVIDRVELPAPGYRLAVRPGTAEIWVTPQEAGAPIAVVDAPRRRLIGTVQAGERPRRIAFSPDGREAWITDPETGQVYVVDAVQRRVRGAIAVGGAPRDVAVDGRHAFVSIQSGFLMALDRQSRRVRAWTTIASSPRDIVLD